MKESYTKPEIAIDLFETEDVITTSTPDLGDDNGTGYPWSGR